MTHFRYVPGADVSLPELVMHFREGCHLCEDMQQQLSELFEPGEFRLTLIDIDEDEELREAYNVRVPVLSLVRLQDSGPSGQSVSADMSETGSAVNQARSHENRLKDSSLQELCEHFLDLVAVREALASYNKPLLAARSVLADR